jgi:myo-inositol catabolism protein IolC
MRKPPPSFFVLAVPALVTIGVSTFEMGDLFQAPHLDDPQSVVVSAASTTVSGAELTAYGTSVYGLTGYRAIPDAIADGWYVSDPAANAGLRPAISDRPSPSLVAFIKTSAATYWIPPDWTISSRS